MIKERLEDNETLQQLPPELFLVLEARKKKKKSGEGGGEKHLFWSCIGSRSVSWLKCRLLLPANGVRDSPHIQMRERLDCLPLKMDFLVWGAGRGAGLA